MAPLYRIAVPATASSHVQDSSRMVVDLRKKVVTKDNYGEPGRAATDDELFAAQEWARTVEAEIADRDARTPAVRPPPPPFALVAAVAAVAGDGLVADAMTMLENAIERKDDIDAAARLLLHHLHAAKRDLRQESDNHLQTDFDTGIPF